MSTEVERIKKLASNDLIVEAVEVQTSKNSGTIAVDDLQEVLSRFEEDSDYAHFVVRVKRSAQSLPKPDLSLESDPQVSIDAMVDETFNLLEEKSQPQNSDLNPDFLLENARLLTEANDYALARNIYQSMIKKAVRISDALAGIAKTYDLEGNLDRAIGYYQEAIAYSSKLSYHQSLAAVFIKADQDEEATKTLLHALGINNLSQSERFDLYKTLGNCFSRLRDYAKAEFHYMKAYEINPDSDVLHVNVGSLALQKEDMVSALKHFHKALEIDPKNDKAISGVGMVQMARGNIEQAYQFFLKALKINVSNLPTIYNLVKCAYELKKFDDSVAVLKQFIETHSTSVNSNILYSYAGLLFHAGRFDESREQVEGILKREPSHAGAKELGEIIKMKLNS